MYLIFFSNRRRHTICALVTGVQRVLFRSDGLFDLIFNFGLLYHLRHPLLALDKTRAVCRGAMILETHVVNAFGNLPASLFYRRDELVTSPKDRKSTRLNSSHSCASRMPSSARKKTQNHSQNIKKTDA